MTAHIRTARCPGCGKCRRLDRTRYVPTMQDDPQRAAADRPKHPVKPVRVCADCERVHQGKLT